MPRRPRQSTGGIVYHVLNRAVARQALFHKDRDYAAFLRTMAQTVARTDMPLLAYCIMPNHWHLLLWPRNDGDLSEFMRLLTVTHTQRYHAHHHTAGDGPLYQGRFKSFPVQDDEHFLTVARYVERNALRANLVRRAENWRWSSLHQRRTNRPGDVDDTPTLALWPVDEPRYWLRTVNTPQTGRELNALRRCVQRGQPYGADRWVERITNRLGLASTFRPRGRPRKASKQ